MNDVERKIYAIFGTKPKKKNKKGDSYEVVRHTSHYIKNDKRDRIGRKKVKCVQCGRVYHLKHSITIKNYICTDCIERNPTIEFYTRGKEEWYLQVRQNRITKPNKVTPRLSEESLAILKLFSKRK